MSFSSIRAVLGGAGRLIKNGHKYNFNTQSVRTLFNGNAVVNLPNRCFTRSLWFMCNKQEQNLIHVKPVAGFPKMCGCCGMHTQGDKEMATFLADEIKMEIAGDKTQGNLPGVSGFDVIKSDGADVVLRKTSNGETITLRFSVNHSIDDNAEMEFEEGKEPETTEMFSRPPFTLEINKGGSKTLAMQCQFPSQDDVPETQGQNEEEYVELIEISEIALLNNNEGNWEDNTYVLSGAMMDGNLYDMLLTMMEERGITADCVDQLVSFSTAYEHNQYVDLLKGIKDFVLEE